MANKKMMGSKYTEDFVPVKNILNGMIQLENGEFVTGVKVEPKNIFILDVQEENNTIFNFRNFYNSINYEFWLIVADRPVDISVYLSQLQILYNNTQDNAKRKLILQDIDKANLFMSTTADVVDTEYFILFKEKKMEVIQKRIQQLISNLASCGLNSKQVSNEDMRMLLDNFFNGAVSTEFKSEIAPKGIEFRTSDFIISDKYATILTVISYPKYIGHGYLANVTSISGVKMIIKHIPIEFQTLSKMINKEIADLKQKYQNEKDLTIQERIRQDYESLEQFIKMLAATQARIFDVQMHLMITADSKEELENKKMQVKSYLDALGMRAISLMFQQEQVLKSIIPIFPSQDVEKRIGTPIPSVTLAAMYPFVFDSIKDPGLSTILGQDNSGGIILFNQFLYQIKKEHNRNNANMIILGTSGSGKSTVAKLLLRGHIRNNYQIVAIDPEGELEEMTKTLGGDFIDLGKGGSFGMINPLEVVVDADEDELASGQANSILTRTIQQIKAFMKYYSPSIEDDVLALFSDVLQDTYKRFKIDYNTDFRTFTPDKYPTFDDIYATIIGRLRAMPEHSQERDIMERLELKVRPLIKELKFYFDGHTTISPKSEFIVFNIKELMNSDESIRNALFFNILKYAWGLSLDKSKNTILSVDEAHVLLSTHNEFGAEFLAQIQRRSRKYNTGTIIITQQPTDFAAPNVLVHGKAIFDNASYYLVMGLRKQAVEDLSKLIDLNESEMDMIKSYSQGEALFVCGSRRMRIRVMLTQEELDSFGSGGGY